MQSYAERERLMKQFHDEPVMPGLVLAKCAAGLLIILGIAGIGQSTPAVGEETAAGVGTHAATDVWQVMAEALSAPRALN
jgi:hypothetical protein